VNSMRVSDLAMDSARRDPNTPGAASTPAPAVADFFAALQEGIIGQALEVSNRDRSVTYLQGRLSYYRAE